MLVHEIKTIRQAWLPVLANCKFMFSLWQQRTWRDGLSRSSLQANMMALVVLCMELQVIAKKSFILVSSSWYLLVAPSVAGDMVYYLCCLGHYAIIFASSTSCSHVQEVVSIGLAWFPAFFQIVKCLFSPFRSRGLDSTALAAFRIQQTYWLWIFSAWNYSS